MLSTETKFQSVTSFWLREYRNIAGPTWRMPPETIPKEVLSECSPISRLSEGHWATNGSRQPVTCRCWGGPCKTIDVCPLCHVRPASAVVATQMASDPQLYGRV